jgi:hypothetical protein
MPELQKERKWETWVHSLSLLFQVVAYSFNKLKACCCVQDIVTQWDELSIIPASERLLI